jgi:ATP-dependent Lon protease
MNKSFLSISCAFCALTATAQTCCGGVGTGNGLLCILSKTDNFDWETLLAAFVGATVVICGYRFQKKNEQEAKNRENSKEAYLKFLNDFTETTVTDVLYDDYFNKLDDNEKQKQDIESRRRKLQARNHILLYGNDKVLTSYLNYIKHIDDVKQKKVEDQQEYYFTELLESIRKEIYPKTTISKNEISKYFNEYNRQ